MMSTISPELPYIYCGNIQIAGQSQSRRMYLARRKIEKDCLLPTRWSWFSQMVVTIAYRSCRKTKGHCSTTAIWQRNFVRRFVSDTVLLFMQSLRQLHPNRNGGGGKRGSGEQLAYKYKWFSLYSSSVAEGCACDRYLLYFDILQF